MDKNLKFWADLEMSKFDSLPPEMRELVRKYGFLPARTESVESYRRHMEAVYPNGVI